MNIKKVIDGITDCKVFNFDEKLDIVDVCDKIENVQKGSLFFCYIAADDNIGIITSAIEKGAVCIVSNYCDFEDAMFVQTQNYRYTKSKIASNFFKTKDIKVIGLTGTNGKTTTSHLIASVLKNAKKKVGVIGSLGAFCDDFCVDYHMTTPSIIELHKTLKAMNHCDYVVLEVSAHGIAQHRAAHLNFVAKVLTNITQDHLDYFKTIENYAKTKLSFFDDDTPCVINCDDSCFLKYKKVFEKSKTKHKNLFYFGKHKKYDYSYTLENQECNKFIVNAKNKKINVEYNFSGLFNVYNSLACIAVCKILEIDTKNIIEGLLKAKQPIGRYNKISKNGKNVIIDFAHTPDGLENVLKSTKKSCKGRLVCLFGCGGEKDELKRPIMAAISEKYADFVFVTIDNPRFEDINKNLHDIEVGFKKHNYLLFPDRTIAVKTAIYNLKKNDILLVCGKGGEKTLEIKGKDIPYCDFDVVNEELDNL